MATHYADPITEAEQDNMNTAIRFIEAFNEDDWDVVREVVAEDYVYHHPLGGTVAAGPEGMVETWAGFKQLSPDSWHPIPIMIAEGEFVAVLLPTYGTFTGEGPDAPPPTGGRLDYGMVNMVRFANGKLTEMWFGMDPLVELRQMGAAPPAPSPELSPADRDHMAAFHRALATVEADYESVSPADGRIVAIGPNQADPATGALRTEVYRFDNGMPELIYANELKTDPPYSGNPSVARHESRSVVDRWFTDVLSGHDYDALMALTTDHVIVHPTAMPAEPPIYGRADVSHWLGEMWAAFDDLRVTPEDVVAHGEIVAVRWIARGTSTAPFMGQEPTGGPVEFDGVSMYRVEDAKVAEIWETRNTFGVLRQLNPNIGAGHSH